MSRVAEFLKSHHIQLALAAGISILLLAYFSKRVLSEPIPTLYRAFPALLAVIAEGVISKNKGLWIANSGYWVAAILVSTAIEIGLHM